MSIKSDKKMEKVFTTRTIINQNILVDTGATNLNTFDQRIHSRYADGTTVLEEQKPNRLEASNRPQPDPNASGPHSQLRWDIINNRIYQAREFDANGYPIRDIDFTSPTYRNGNPRPDHAPPPHQHLWQFNDPQIGPRSGFKRQAGRGFPLDSPN